MLAGMLITVQIMLRISPTPQSQTPTSARSPDQEEEQAYRICVQAQSQPLICGKGDFRGSETAKGSADIKNTFPQRKARENVLIGQIRNGKYTPADDYQSPSYPHPARHLTHALD